MVKRFAVIGLGYFGQRIALELTERGAEVIVIDNTMSKIEDFKDKVTYAIRLDSTDDNALRNQGLEELDGIIVAIGEDFESALLTCAYLIKYKCKNIIVRSTSPVHTQIFKSIGVTHVISPEEIMAERLAMTLVSKNVLDLIPLTEEYSILQVKAPKHMIGYSLKELDMRRKYGVNLITIKRAGGSAGAKGDEEPVESIIGVPMPETEILNNDILVLLGREKEISKMIEE